MLIFGGTLAILAILMFGGGIVPWPMARSVAEAEDCVVETLG